MHFTVSNLEAETPQIPIDIQVAELYLDQFPGIPDAQARYHDTGHYESAGVIMASYLKRGDTERFQRITEELAVNPEYRAAALISTLNYSERDAVPPVLEAIDNVDPASLALDTRVQLMASITKALLRDEVQESGAGWKSYHVQTDELFEAVTGQEMFDSSVVEDIFHISRFTDIPNLENYVGYLAATIQGYIRSPEGNRIIHTGFGSIRTGEIVAGGALHALDSLGFIEQEKKLLGTIAQDPNYGAVIAVHLEDLLRNDKASSKGMYEVLQANRDDLVYMNSIDGLFAEYLARNGEIEEAATRAEQITVYHDRTWIAINMARNLYAQGDQEQAKSVLQQAADLDPLAVEPYASDDESYEDLYEGMPNVDDIDEDDLVAVSAFNDEVAARSSLRHKAAYELKQEQGHELESIAEAAANIGAFDLAIDAFARSRQYPMQTEVRMAETALERGSMLTYVEATLSSEALRDYDKATVLNQALDTFHKRPDRFGNEENQVLERQLQALAHDFVDQRIAALTSSGEIANYLGIQTLGNLLVRCDDHQAAIELLSGKNAYARGTITSTAIQQLAYAGRTNEAVQLYLNTSDRPTEVMSLEAALKAIVVNSLLLRDEQSARIAVLELQEYRRGWFMASVFREIGKVATNAPDWLLRLSLGTEKYSTRAEVKTIAAAIKRARLVKHQFEDETA